MTQRHLAVAALVGSLTVAATILTPAPASAQAEQLPVACGTRRSLPWEAEALNNLGVIGGQNDEGRPALRWFGVNQALNRVGGQDASVTGLADNGRAAGSLRVSGGDETTIFRWWLLGRTQRLEATGGRFRTAAAINNSGTVLLSENDGPDGSVRVARLWGRGDNVDTLASPALGGDIFGADLNSAGWAVGYIQRPTPYYPFATDGLVWSPTGEVTELPSLFDYTDQTVPDNDGMVLPVSIDRFNRVYGTVMGPDEHLRAFRWSRSGGMVDLGGVGDWMRVFDANDRGDLVGTYSLNGLDVDRVFIHTAENGFRDLGIDDVADVNSFQSEHNFEINDLRQVVGHYPVAFERSSSDFIWSPGRCR